MITNQMLGNAYVNARKYDLAIVQYQKALELHPNDSTLLYHLGWAYVYTHDMTRASKRSRTALHSRAEIRNCRRTWHTSMP